MMKSKTLFLLAWVGMFAPAAPAELLDLSRATVVVSDSIARIEVKAAAMLVDEIENRSRVRLETSAELPAGNQLVILLGTAKELAAKSFRPPSGLQVPEKPDALALWVDTTARSGPTICVAGYDQRGALFAAGRLLRLLEMGRDKVLLDNGTRLASAPQIPLRGHQMGFRPKTNSYDAWTLAMWEQYLRDMIVFGMNAVELIPPRSDDDLDSPHFPKPPMEMMTAMSQLVSDYGLELWVWYPAIDKDYTDPKTIEMALREREEVFRRLPRINAVFVPGGDPGDTRPDILFKFMEQTKRVLNRHHPNAQLWVSPQGFDRPGKNREGWLKMFYEILQQQEPKWLDGVVFGPQVEATIAALRKEVPSRYPIRNYPDITHSRGCQYPVPEWDKAYNDTEGRECINPRPLAYAKIFHEVQPHAEGFITYSEGCNDDFNKVLWSCLGWNPEMRVEQVVREYSRYLVSARYEEPFSRGLLALEQNWAGPLLLNTGVEKTLGLFQDMERGATPQEKLNWRFQQGLYRAYYDAYIRARLIYETGLERHALAVLAAAREGESLSALNQAEGILNQAGPGKTSPELRSRVHELAEALYQSIRMQSSVGKYQAISVGRGTTLDTLDKPLNRATELKKVFTKIRQLPSEEERLTAIAKLGGVDGTRSERAGAPALEFISVPSGSFEMGADLTRDHVVSERGIFIQDEFPVRRVTLTKPFDISKYEIKNVEYEKYDPAHAAWRGKAPGISVKDDDAVVYVNWNDAQGYCAWLSKSDARYDYRLPTEAEWEYACRARSRTPYNNGVAGDIYTLDPLGPLAAKWRVITNWLVTRGNRPTQNIAHVDPLPADLSVFLPGTNAWGLVGMMGGVEEWTQDWYGPYLETDSVDPVGYAEGSSRVVRGGSHNVHLQTLRSANRSSALPTDKHFLLGFRVVRVPKGQAVPSPTLRQPVKQWATGVAQKPYAWPGDTKSAVFRGPVSLYDVGEKYHSPELQAQFEIPLYTHNHSPTITWAENGDLLMAWFSGESEKGQELTVLGLRGRRQPDGALAWDTQVSEFFRCADRNMHGSQLWNNGVRLANGFKEPFTLYHINGIGTDGRWAKLAMSFRTSTNNGASWSPPVIMKQDADADHLSADRNQPQGDVIVTSDGDFLSFSDGAARGGTGASLNFSDDAGRTWSVRGLHGPPGVHVGSACLEDGSVLAFSRDKGANFGSLPQSISTDKGLTWNSSGSEFPPVGTIQRLVLLRLAHSHPAFDPENQGRRPLLLVSFADNGMAGVDATGKPATIYGTYAALSWNGGKTWPIKRVLSNVKAGKQEFIMGPWSKTFELDPTHGQPEAYWAACQTPDGIIHLTDSRLYYVFNLAWLLNSPETNSSAN